MHPTFFGNLHTKSKKYNNLTSYAVLNKRADPWERTIQKIDEQYSALLVQEAKFYQQFFPGVTTFDKFKASLQDIFIGIPGGEKDREFFRKMSAAEAGNLGVYERLKRELSLNLSDIGDQQIYSAIGLKGTRKNQNPTKLITDKKGNIKSANTIQKELNDFTISLAPITRYGQRDNKGRFIIDLKVDNKIKNLDTKVDVQIKPLINQILSEYDKNIHSEINIDEFVNIIVPRLTKMLQEERTRLIKDPNTRFTNKNTPVITDQRIYGKFLPLFRKAFQDKFGKDVTKAEIDMYYNWGIAKSLQTKVFNGNEAIKLNTIYNFFMNLMKGCSSKMFTAFEKVWSKEKNNMATFAFNSVGNVTGYLGEFSGALLFEYLSSLLPINIIGRESYKEWGEPMRSDLRVGDMGIQVKNWKESGLLKSGLTTKLHPRQVLTRLAGADITKNQYATLETLMANVGFNSDFAEQVIGDQNNILSTFLSQFLGYLGNFMGPDGAVDENALLEGENFLDTSGMWLVGGTMLVPGSSILKGLRDTLQRFNKGNTSITFQASTKNLLSDNDFNEIVDGTTHPAFTNYWRRTNLNSQGWRPTTNKDIVDEENNKETYNNILSGQNVTIQVKFYFYDIIKAIGEAGQFAIV